MSKIQRGSSVAPARLPTGIVVPYGSQRWRASTIFCTSENWGKPKPCRALDTLVYASQNVEAAPCYLCLSPYFWPSIAIPLRELVLCVIALNGWIAHAHYFCSKMHFFPNSGAAFTLVIHSTVTIPRQMWTGCLQTYPPGVCQKALRVIFSTSTTPTGPHSEIVRHILGLSTSWVLFFQASPIVEKFKAAVSCKASITKQGKWQSRHLSSQQ